MYSRVLDERARPTLPGTLLNSKLACSDGETMALYGVLQMYRQSRLDSVAKNGQVDVLQNPFIKVQSCGTAIPQGRRSHKLDTTIAIHANQLFYSV